jgi:hypothetical protein
MNRNATLSLFMIVFFLSVQSCKKDDFHWNLKKAPEIGDLTITSNSEVEFELSTKCVSIGYDKEVEMGYCWSTSPNPTIEDNLLPVQNKEEGTFSVSIPWTNVSTYQVRAYVKNGVTTVYSENRTVHWPGNTTLPQIQTVNVDQISFYSLNVNCNILSTGGNSIIEKGVYLYSSPSTGSPALLQTIVSTSASNSFSAPFSGLIDGETYLVQSFATTLAGTFIGNIITVSLPKKYEIGEIGPSNGFIIFENPDQYGSWHYLEAAPIDITGIQVPWSPIIGLTNTTSIDFGDCVPNTNAVTTLYGNSSIYAAKSANDWSFGGTTDWMLPTFNELKLMKEVLFDQGLGNFSAGSTYWSSSEDDNYYSNAWTVNMSLSGQNLLITQSKNQVFKVRAIRRF